MASEATGPDSLIGTLPKGGDLVAGTAFDPAVALDQRRDAHHHAGQRADDLQRPSPRSTGASTARTPITPGCRSATTRDAATCGSAQQASAPPGFSGIGPTRPAGSTMTRFPGWATIPSAITWRWRGAGTCLCLALAASFRLYAVVSLVNGHLRRDLLPKRHELTPRHVWTDIKHHATLNFPKGRRR